MFSLHELNVFLTAAELGNFSEAARRLNISQPAVSQAISSLEKHFGMDLFLRHGRSVRLTEAGRQTYEALDAAGSRMISDLLDLIPRQRQDAIVDAMEEVANLLNPNNEAFLKLLQGCRCGISDSIDKN